MTSATKAGQSTGYALNAPAERSALPASTSGAVARHRAMSQITSYGYDANGNLTSVTDALSRTTRGHRDG